jgi:predicted TIM-barrel fold metal-dependent hydrolase
MSTDASAPVFDCDQHYYEPLDAFTRHRPTGWAERTVQVAQIEGRTRMIVGGKVSNQVTNPTFDPIVKAGAMTDYFRGNKAGLRLQDYLAQREPIPDSYRNRDARIDLMDSQELQAVWMLPTLAMGIEECLQYDVEATAVAFKAFNRSLLDDWRFNHSDRIFTSPYLAFGDVDACVAEIEHGLDNDARLFVVRPQATFTPDGWKSPGDPYFDRIWARLEEAGTPLVPHVGEVGGAGLDRYVEHRGNIIGDVVPPIEVVMGHERAIGNYLGALTCDRLFERFPDIKIASVENGADFLPLLLAGLRRVAYQRIGYFASDPVEQFLSHVWVSPFWEDDVVDVVRQLGASQVLFGSDFPHAEGLAEPRQYEKVVAELGDPVAERRIMWDNTAALTRLSAPVAA